MGAVVSDIWTVPATVVRVVDADTLLLHLSLGWHIYLDSRVRLIGCNAPEMSTEEGAAAKAWVMDLLSAHGGALDGSGVSCTFVSHELDKYGRPLGQVLLTTSQGGTTDLGLALMQADHAIPMR
jgi:endonuclease YncB( thermonuclease family)